MEPGKLRHRAILKRATLSEPGETGARTRTYAEYATVWAGFQPQSMSAAESSDLNGQRAMVVRTLIVMRRRADIAPQDRIEWDDGRVFDVLGIVNVFEMTDEMIISAAQVVT